jgi:hypothetical protein
LSISLYLSKTYKGAFESQAKVLLISISSFTALFPVCFLGLYSSLVWRHKEILFELLFQSSTQGDLANKKTKLNF